MHIYLVTHAKEHDRRSNTGKLISQFMPDECTVLTWHRTEPDEQLLRAIQAGRIALLAPDTHIDVPEKQRRSAVGIISMPVAHPEFDSFVILDSTWQEASKMYRHSRYLQDLPKLALPAEQVSAFILRANQVAGGLSTVECAIALLYLHQRHQDADALQACFQQFIRACL